MARHEIKLTTPVWSSKEHPTGEAILEVANFKNAEEFRTAVTQMISRHMSNIIAPGDEITLEDGLSIEYKENEVLITSDKGIILKLETKGQPEMFVRAFDALKKGYRLKRDIVSELAVIEEGKIFPTELIYFVLNKWWNLGLIKTKSGKL